MPARRGRSSASARYWWHSAKSNALRPSRTSSSSEGATTSDKAFRNPLPRRLLADSRRLPRAEERYRESLRAALDLGDVIETSFEVQGVAMAWAGQGDSARALELDASVEALWRSLGTRSPVAFWERLLERYLGDARCVGAGRRGGRTRGLELPFDDAVALALREDA